MGNVRRRLAACAAFLSLAVVGGAVLAAPASAVDTRVAAAVPAAANPLPGVVPLGDPAGLSVLVNKSRPLNPASYAPGDLVNARGSGQYLRAEAAAWLNGLFQGAADAGTGGLAVVSGYRSYAQQQQLYAYYVSIYGQAQADLISARPGYSEHQTGLAVDVGNANGSCGLSTCFGDTAAGIWVAANAYKYGFIVRYPNGYTGTTGYSYEPWHLRYVGVDLATDMKRRGIPTMEHYFAGNPSAYASITSGADLVAADPNGRLLRYPAQAWGGYGAPVQIGSNWTGLKQAFVVDWDSDGVYDILAQWNNGTLGLFKGWPGGAFSTQIVVGTGDWDKMTITVGKWSNAQGYPGIVGYFPDGGLRYYPNTSGRALTYRVDIGSGWAGMGLTMADWDADGANDILATNTSGQLLSYRGNGAGGFAGLPVTVGSGWGTMKALVPTFGLSGPGTRSITAQTVDGYLVSYGLGLGAWTTQRQVGNGWSGMKLFK
ncbi:M15 family metallopeptidase [Paenarthrobacter sp. UW852]|uniref:M15 family metallopeptidase n=1 Tax=Paenarthrobacter sp. UW852 TaxID=2951989 RepID=UPI002149063F|nr:M15 family metallopeptidase [Paenarthrobacter sp. UW852]MCR1161476.1 M15 family metallopeptidase [Paenarthrobacter sp. UW852]